MDINLWNGGNFTKILDRALFQSFAPKHEKKSRKIGEKTLLL